MKRSEIKKELADRLLGVLEESGSLAKPPRPFQYDTLRKIQEWLSDESGSERAHIVHATGLGKTVLSAIFVRGCAGIRTLIVVPTKPLIVQTAKKVSEYVGGIIGHVSSLGNIFNDAGELVAVRGYEDQDVVITTDASLRADSGALMRTYAPHVVLRDECHWAYSGPSQDVLRMAGEAVILGFSATPDYLGTAKRTGYVPVTLENGRVLYGPRDKFAETHFGKCLDVRTPRWGIENGWLAPLAWGRIGFKKSLDELPIKVTSTGADYDEAALQRLMTENWSMMLDTVARLYENGEYDLPNHQSFAICPGVPAAEELAERMNKIGVRSACVTGDTTDAQREIIFKQYKDNEIQLISSVMVLREGWDAPNAEVCLMLRPTLSRVFYEQGLGRTLRLDPDGEHKVALVLDAHFEGAEFTPLSAPILYGKPGEEIADGDMLVKRRRRIGTSGGPRGSRGSVQGGSGDSAVDTTSEGKSPYLPKSVTPTLVIIPALEEDGEEQLLLDENGMVMIGEEEWGMQGAWAKRYGITSTTISSRLENGRARFARSRNGFRVRIYGYLDICRYYPELMTTRARKEDDCFEEDGELWGTEKSIAAKLSISASTIKKNVAGCRSRSGRTHVGAPRTFYAVSDVRKKFEYLLDIPGAEEDGTFEFKKERWGTAQAISELLKISITTIFERVEGCRNMKGRSRRGIVETFYAVADVKEKCKNLLVPTAEDDGFFSVDGEEWGSERALSRRLGVTVNKGSGKLSKVRSRPGKMKRSGVYTFYALSDVREAYADLLAKKK